MTVTQRDRDFDRPKWQELTSLAARAAAKPGALCRELQQMARAAGGWRLPTPERDEELTCIALMHTARAYAAQTSSLDREALAPALACLACAAGELMNVQLSVEPTRAFRADIDG